MARYQPFNTIIQYNKIVTGYTARWKYRQWLKTFFIKLTQDQTDLKIFCELPPRLREEFAELKRQRDCLLQKLEKYSASQKYLDQVLESVDEFQEIRELIARYDTLTATYKVCCCRILCVAAKRAASDCIVVW